MAPLTRIKNKPSAPRHGIRPIKQQDRLVKAPFRLNTSVVRSVSITNIMNAVRPVAIFFVGMATLAGARGNVLFAGGAWAAIDRGTTCEALSRSQKVMPRDKVQPVAGLSFTPDYRRWGEFHVRLSRMPRSDSSVILQIGDQPFLLTTRAGACAATPDRSPC